MEIWWIANSPQGMESKHPTETLVQIRENGLRVIGRQDHGGSFRNQDSIVKAMKMLLAGARPAQISRELGFHKDFVHNWAKRLGIPKKKHLKCTCGACTICYKREYMKDFRKGKRRGAKYVAKGKGKWTKPPDVDS